jgi:predicted SAM-dependent methyltransferase
VFTEGKASQPPLCSELVPRKWLAATAVIMGRMGKSWTTWRNSRGELWLNVGSSYLVLDGFVNLDRSVWLTLAPAYPLLKHTMKPARAEAIEGMAKARKKAMVVTHDCRKPLPVPNGTVDHILCSHFLEHVPADKGRAILADFSRALRPAGTLHLILPDIRYHVERYVSGATDADGFVEETILGNPGRSRKFRLLENFGGFGLKHQWMYDQISAERRVEAAGLKVVGRGTPTVDFRCDDPESLHVFAERPAG